MRSEPVANPAPREPKGTVTVMAYNLISGNPDLDLITGAYDIVGANPMQNSLAQLRQQAAYQQQAGMQQMLMQKQVASGALLRTMNPTKARKQVLGMASNGTIAAAGSATITARPQTFAFKPERLFIPATVGPSFTIQDIKVGNVSQLVQSGDLPAEAFSQTSFGIEMDMDTVQTSQDFIVQVTNIGGSPRTFRALVLGRSANG